MGMRKTTRAEFSTWTKEQKEAFLLTFVEESIKVNHVSGLSTYYDDEKGVYLLKSDGSKEYVEFYEER